MVQGVKALRRLPLDACPGGGELASLLSPESK